MAARRGGADELRILEAQLDRMRGMLGMLGRIKRSVRDQLEARTIG